MKKLKFIFVIALLGLFTLSSSFIGFSTPAFAENSSDQRFHKAYTYTNEQNISLSLDYTSAIPINGEVIFTFSSETNEETLKKFKKYCKKKIDSADVSAVIYVDMEITDPEAPENLGGTFKYTISIPEKLQKKDMAIIPFTDYRSPQTVKQLTKNADGTWSFSGAGNIYAYALVYNGAYKQVIWIGVIMLAVLIICVLVKIYCLRKDNPEIAEKKKQKAIDKKKQQHKQNKRLAQELKREREKLKKKK